MNKKDLARRTASIMREHDIRKPIRSTKHVFHISDDEGNSKDFVVKKSEKEVLFTVDDVEAMLDACIYAIEDAIKRGDEITVRGFGTLGLKLRKKRAAKIPGTEEWVNIEERYVPKFVFGDRLRACARIYEVSADERSTGKTISYNSDETVGGD